MNSTPANLPTATSPTIFGHTESFLTLLFAVSVFVWKPGIYVSSSLIIAYLATRAFLDINYRQMLWQSKLTKLTFAMFALGLFTSAISANQFEDFSWMARKTMFLPAIVFFTFALAHQRNKDIAMTGLVAGFWIASLITLSRYGWQINFGGRMQGIWPQGTWDNLLGLFLCFLVLYAKWANSKIGIRVVYIATMLMAFLMVLLAGGRGPWLALAISLIIYFVFFKRDKKVVITMIVGAAIAVIAGTTVLHDRTQALLGRVTSIADTKEASNSLRLQLWAIGTAHMKELIKAEPFKALFGLGTKSYQTAQHEFFKTMDLDQRARIDLAGFSVSNGDVHNNYIDSALRSGLVWTSAMFLYLIWLPTRFRLSQIRTKPEPAIMLMYFCIMAMFYTVVPHFMSFFFALFLSLLGLPLHQSNLPQKHEH